MIEKKYDVVALGELLIDFTENGLSGQGNPLLEANPGGAPCNVLAMLNKLKKKTAFIGKVGEDTFGRMLRDAVETSGTDVSGLVMDKDIHTTLAFVHTLPGGDREFSFYRNPGADMMLTKAEVRTDLIMASRIFHFGTLSSTHPGVREATRHALDVAIRNGLLISFDPNLREPLWESPDQAREEIEYGLARCDILKISDNEVAFLTGTSDYVEGGRLLKERFDIPLVLVTKGANGSLALCKDLLVEAPPFLRDDTIETTGAGDTFFACVLNYVLEHCREARYEREPEPNQLRKAEPGRGLEQSQETEYEREPDPCQKNESEYRTKPSQDTKPDRGLQLDSLTASDLENMLRFANAGASIITSRRGALKVMPERAEIEALLRVNKLKED